MSKPPKKKSHQQKIQHGQPHTTSQTQTATIPATVVVQHDSHNTGASPQPLDTDSEKQQHWLLRLLKGWRSGAVWLATLILANIVVTVQGEPALIVTFVHQHPSLSISIGSLLVVITLASVLVPLRSDLFKKADPYLLPKRTSERIRAWMLSILLPTILPIVSFSLIIILISVVLIRPSWCPTAFCPAARLVTNPLGAHDTNLEIYFTTVQSPAYVLSQNPTHYTLDTLPEDISAARIDEALPYRAVLGVHSLQQGRYGLFIEHVALIVQQLPNTPSPLNVWQSHSLSYQSNIYQVTYNGEHSGKTISAVNLLSPGGPMQLNPGEADAIDLQVLSTVTVNLRFQVQVTYRVANESQRYELALPQSFLVVFSNKDNWHPYRLQQDGHLVASS